MAKVLGRDVLGKIGLKQATVDIPEWDGAVIVRELNAAEAMEVQQIAVKAVDTNTAEVKDAQAMASFQLRLVTLGWIDEDGNRVLSDGEDELLLKESQAVVTRMATAISELSGLAGDDDEEPEKNS